jgi:A/G-specific adenine glycosylase
VSKLLLWHRKAHRDFPWRATHDPYRVLFTEQLLRKTTARQVNEIYASFFEQYPHPRKLANAALPEIRSVVRSLGIEYARSKALKQLAGDITGKYKGSVPLDKESLLSLRHVGDYAANAVMTSCAGKEEPMVDRNMVRVVSRFFGLALSKNERRNVRDVADFLNENFRQRFSRHLNYAVLDFAALVCKAKQPDCPNCVLRVNCSYFKQLLRQQ